MVFHFLSLKHWHSLKFWKKQDAFAEKEILPFPRRIAKGTVFSCTVTINLLTTDPVHPGANLPPLKAFSSLEGRGCGVGVAVRKEVPK